MGLFVVHIRECDGDFFMYILKNFKRELKPAVHCLFGSLYDCCVLDLKPFACFSISMKHHFKLHLLSYFIQEIM
jgi:Tat protein secretion system quality control protein TatD with DNase activity